MSESPSLHWHRKLNALLHDTPDKATDIQSHENRASQIKAIFQFNPAEWFDKSADWSAAAADRLPFPVPGQLTQPLSEIKVFPHPLGGAELPNVPFKSADEALGVTQKSHPFLLKNDDRRAAFLCIWRFWRNWATSLDARFTRLPADTRIPDHTIWNHLNVTTAFQGSLPAAGVKSGAAGENTQPRLVLFSIGPVQEFIAASRSTRDLWSGSYLLSWLVSHALGKIAREIGPDHVIFPNLLDQPLIDLQFRGDLFSKVTFSGQSIWDGLRLTDERLPTLLTPSLPNRFMALLPARHHGTGETIEAYAKVIAQAVRDELGKIAESVKNFLTSHPDPKVAEFDASGFPRQVDRMLEVQWQTFPVPSDLEELRKASGALLPPDHEAAAYTPHAAVDAIRKMIGIPECKPQHGVTAYTGWALLNALIAFLHDGVKGTRSFDAWRGGRWESGKAFNKDALNGKEEAVLRVHPDTSATDVERYCASTLGLSKGTLKPGELLGASTLIKRFWHHTYLPAKLIPDQPPVMLRKKHPMPNTRAVAAGEPYSTEDEEAESRDHSDKYFAILALDGDEMGKWVSGSKSPANGEMLSPGAREFYAKHAPDFLLAPRAVTPSWHLQFAEALGNFSFHAVQRIVEAFDGRLLYAGGDDVLAMLPAKDAIPCARALRAAFRGEKALNDLARGIVTGKDGDRKSDRITPLFNIQHEGFLQLHEKSGAAHGVKSGLLSDPVSFPAIVPGPRTDVSVGIAMAHFKAPLQDVVRAAQAAEKRAKRAFKEGGHGRGALAVSIFKRSGEILEWGTRWSVWKSDPPNLSNPSKHESPAPKPLHPSNQETAGYRLLHTLSDALLNGQLNSRFPHKLEALLVPYLPQSRDITAVCGFDDNFPSILRLELLHCLQRNEGGKLTSGTEKELLSLAAEYWEELRESSGFGPRLTCFISLLRTAAWSVRGAEPASGPSSFLPAQASTPV